MRYQQPHNKTPKTALAVVMLMLLLLQSVATAVELAVDGLHMTDSITQSCSDHCSDALDDIADAAIDQLEDAATVFCDDCEHCLGCHLTAIIDNPIIHPAPEPRSGHTPMIGLVRPRPSNIDRPPIA